MADTTYTTLRLDETTARLDAATSIMALISDLLVARREGELTLTNAGANGLYDLASEWGRATTDALAVIQELAHAKNDMAKSLDEATKSDLYERGYREGYAVAVIEPGIPAAEDREAVLAYGVKLGFMSGWREAASGGTDRALACQLAVADSLRVVFREAPQDQSGAEPSGPNLTEPVPESKRDDHQQQSRQSA